MKICDSNSLSINKNDTFLYVIKKNIIINEKLQNNINLVSVVMLSVKVFTKIYNCSEKINFENFLKVLLNMESIGKKERIIITGTPIEVAVIWFLDN